MAGGCAWTIVRRPSGGPCGWEKGTIHALQTNKNKFSLSTLLLKSPHSNDVRHMRLRTEIAAKQCEVSLNRYNVRMIFGNEIEFSSLGLSRSLEWKAGFHVPYTTKDSTYSAANISK